MIPVASGEGVGSLFRPKTLPIENAIAEKDSRLRYVRGSLNKCDRKELPCVATRSARPRHHPRSSAYCVSLTASATSGPASDSLTEKSA